jgi:hypothetical protein
MVLQIIGGRLVRIGENCASAGIAMVGNLRIVSDWRWWRGLD